MASLGFLTNHARAVLVLATAPDMRLKDLARQLGVAERTASGIVSDLTDAGYVVKKREGRRNRYLIHEELPLSGAPGGQPTVGGLLKLFG